MKFLRKFRNTKRKVYKYKQIKHGEHKKLGQFSNNIHISDTFCNLTYTVAPRVKLSVSPN